MKSRQWARRWLSEPPTGDAEFEARVTGVIEDMPFNAHFHMDFIVSMSSGNGIFPDQLYSMWGWDADYTYVILPRNLAAEAFSNRLLAFGEKHIQGDWFIQFFAQKMTDIHLYSHLNSEIEPNSDISYIYIFSIVALVILLIACINYMNLATARATKRSKEVGIRKTVGASRSQIATQFFSESVLIAFIAFGVALLLAELTLPLFNQFSGKHLELTLADSLGMLSVFAFLTLILGIVAGSYPAVILSSFQAIAVLKDRMTKLGSASLRMRRGLVAIQFTLSIALIVGAVVVYNQLNYLRGMKIGAETDHVVMVPMESGQLRDSYPAMRSELLNNPDILHVAQSSRRIGRDINSGTIITAEADNGDLTNARLSTISVDWDFFTLYDVDVVEGRMFSREFVADTTQGSWGTILNKSAAEVLGLTPATAIGKTIKNGTFESTVVGVVEDFHFEVLYNKIKPMIFYLTTRNRSWVSIKIGGQNVAQSLAYIENTWKKFAGDRIFVSSFLDQDLYQLYVAEERFLNVFTAFSILAIFTGCLGIFGLASFIALQRAKEIGIRKVLGASVPRLVALLNREFMILVAVAFVLAAPLSYAAMNAWLQNFAYRTDIGYGVFVLAGVAAAIIALVSVTFQSLKAALTNPGEVLRTE